MSTALSRVFNNGNSQAVRIPAEFRLDTDRVRITRTEQGDLLIQPLRPARAEALLQALQALTETDPDFVEAVMADRAARQPPQEREDW
ncbi:MAG: AbrB/MazE/SpoVT family DNA-binding domain-containing protein [Xanthomonadales bacterium]|jgi:antitoxin VapB|nr:AbrB/MazE/SpoVT family DNA-binding domain-containing protein [Xanthomonadales bacterium]